MVHLINNYSFVAISLLALLLMLPFTWKFFTKELATASIIIVVISLVVFQITASTRTNAIESPSDFDDALAYGKPILLEVYSNY